MSASGSPHIKIFSTEDADFPLSQTLDNAHKLGCHHLAISRNGKVLASTGFGGETKIWVCSAGIWSEQGMILGLSLYQIRVRLTWNADRYADGNSTGEVWAIAMSEDGSYLASTTINGCVNVWKTFDGREKIRKFETKGNFGTSIDLVSHCQSAKK